MKNTFLGYFDIMGFKNFIYNNENTDIERLFNNILRDSQFALSGGKGVNESPSVLVADLRLAKINCLHISDSIIFWTNDVSVRDFEEFISVIKYFMNSFYGGHHFPIRGCLTFGEINYDPLRVKSETGGSFNNFSIYGKALIEAYLKADSLELMTCMLDKKLIEFIKNVEFKETLNQLISDETIVLYNTPFKTGKSYEFILKPFKGKISEIGLKNIYNGLVSAFTYFTKDSFEKLSLNVLNKLNNTFELFCYFRSNDPYPTIPSATQP